MNVKRRVLGQGKSSYEGCEEKGSREDWERKEGHRGGNTKATGREIGNATPHIEQILYKALLLFLYVYLELP